MRCTRKLDILRYWNLFKKMFYKMKYEELHQTTYVLLDSEMFQFHESFMHKSAVKFRNKVDRWYHRVQGWTIKDFVTEPFQKQNKKIIHSCPIVSAGNRLQKE